MQYLKKRISCKVGIIPKKKYAMEDRAIRRAASNWIRKRIGSEPTGSTIVWKEKGKKYHLYFHYPKRSEKDQTYKILLYINKLQNLQGNTFLQDIELLIRVNLFDIPEEML